VLVEKERAEPLAVDNSRVKSLTFLSLFLSLSLSLSLSSISHGNVRATVADRVLGNDERLIRVASTADTASGWPVEPSFPPRLSHARSGDTTSVSRTPQDEQQPIPRFIGLFAYMLQGCVTCQMTPATAAARRATPLNPGRTSPRDFRQTGLTAPDEEEIKPHFMR